MPKGKVKREPYTGIKLAKLPERYLTAEGVLDVGQWPDANLYDLDSFAAEAGYDDARYFRERVLTDPSSPFHAHRLLADNGAVLGLVTHVDSARAGGAVYGAAARQRQLAGFVTDVTPGSVTSPAFQTLKK